MHIIFVKTTKSDLKYTCYDAQCVCDTFKMSFTEKGRLIAVYCVVGPFATKNVTITKYSITSTTKVDEEL